MSAPAIIVIEVEGSEFWLKRVCKVTGPCARIAIAAEKPLRRWDAGGPLGGSCRSKCGKRAKPGSTQDQNAGERDRNLRSPAWICGYF